MSRKLDSLEIKQEGKPTKTYMFEADAEYNGVVFHKFQRKTQLREGAKWQTLTVSPKDWPEFAEWIQYILEEIGDGSWPETGDMSGGQRVDDAII